MPSMSWYNTFSEIRSEPSYVTFKGIMVKPTIVIECCHRFCYDCIQKCIRSSIKECPTCRVKIPSRRSLKNDSEFDDFISAIFSNAKGSPIFVEALDDYLSRSMDSNNSTLLPTPIVRRKKRSVESASMTSEDIACTSSTKIRNVGYVCFLLELFDTAKAKVHYPN